MYSLSKGISIALCAVVIPAAAIAHHNAASHYLIDQTITVHGVVTEFRLINPHARIYFDVAGDDGSTQHWLGEGNASSLLKRRGWTRDTLKPGDVITISGSPARDGGYKIDWQLIVLADGTELHGGNTYASERERQLRELDRKRKQSEQ